MNQPEYRLQCVVADYLDWACPYPWTAIPLDGYRTKATGARMKRAGAKRGWPDIIILTPQGTIQLELKTAKGRLSRHQEAHGLWLRGMLPNHIYRVCRSLDDVEVVLRQHGVPLRARAA